MHRVLCKLAFRSCMAMVNDGWLGFTAAKYLTIIFLSIHNISYLNIGLALHINNIYFERNNVNTDNATAHGTLAVQSINQMTKLRAVTGPWKFDESVARMYMTFVFRPVVGALNCIETVIDDIDVPALLARTFRFVG